MKLIAFFIQRYLAALLGFQFPDSGIEHPIRFLPVLSFAVTQFGGMAWNGPAITRDNGKIATAFYTMDKTGCSFGCDSPGKYAIEIIQSFDWRSILRVGLLHCFSFPANKQQ